MNDKKDTEFQNPYAAEIEINSLKLKVNIFMIAIMLLAVILIAVALFSGFSASGLNRHPFIQSLLTETSGGIGIFMLSPIFIILGNKLKNRLILISIAVFGILCCLAYYSTGIMQSLLIEFSIGILLLTALEIVFRKLIQETEQRIQATDKQIKRIETRIVKMKEAEVDFWWSNGINIMSPEMDEEINNPEHTDIRQNRIYKFFLSFKNFFTGNNA